MNIRSVLSEVRDRGIANALRDGEAASASHQKWDEEFRALVIVTARDLGVSQEDAFAAFGFSNGARVVRRGRGSGMKRGAQDGVRKEKGE